MIINDLFNNKKTVVAEGPNDGREDNFTIDDIKRLETIRDLETLKAQAKELIKGKPARRMKPEKISWFYNHIDTLKSPLAVIKMMYDLMLAGEGNKVIGSKNSMASNSYRSRFGEQGMAEDTLDEAVGMMIKGAVISGVNDQDIADRIAAKTGGRVDSGSYGHHILIIYPTTQHRAEAAVKIRKMFPGIELYKSGGNRNAIDEQGMAEGSQQTPQMAAASKALQAGIAKAQQQNPNTDHTFATSIIKQINPDGTVVVAGDNSTAKIKQLLALGGGAQFKVVNDQELAIAQQKPLVQQPQQGMAEGTEPVTFAGKDPMSFKSPKGGTPKMMIVTGQGSRYLITSDGMVLRNKSFHANTGGEDQGLKDWSDAIEFYDPAEQPGGTPFPLSVAKAVEKRLPVALSKTNDGKRVLLILDGSQWRIAKISDVYKHVATTDDPIVGTYSTTPKLNWNVLDYTIGPNGALKSVHPGSPVTHGIRLGQQGVAEGRKPFRDLKSWADHAKSQGLKVSRSSDSADWTHNATDKQGNVRGRFVSTNILQNSRGFIHQQGMAEGKKPDSYHIVNKDGKPATLASYADRASAEKDRDAKHPGAEVRQLGPRGKVKNVSEVSLGDYRKKAALDKAVAQTDRFFGRDDAAKVAAADQTIAKRERGLARADARSRPYTPPKFDAEKHQRDLTAKYPNIDELVANAERNRDPYYDRAEGNAYYHGREAEQNYQKLKQIQRVIQGLNESLQRTQP